MASVITHALSASLVAVTAAGVRPDEPAYIAAALVSASILDLDHIPYVLQNFKTLGLNGFQGKLHHSRSLLHELAGLLIAGCFAGGISIFNVKLAQVVLIAFAVHIVEDWLLGKSAPLIPVDDTQVQYFQLSFRQKVAIDLTILVAAVVIWIIYLAGG
jgi:hypothetical protein